jgi:hypothetical protein
VIVSPFSFDETVMLEAAFLPKLNLASFGMDQTSVDSRSPADTTAVFSAVNAAAMKYLNDRQLVQQVAIGTSRPAASRSNDTCDRTAGLANASVYGLRSANLSMASRKYFEKHGLTVRSSSANQNTPMRNEQTAARSNRKDLLESISSQVNNLQLAASPGRGASLNCETFSDYDPSVYDGDGNGERSWMSYENATSFPSDPDRYSGHERSMGHHHQSKREKDRSAMSDPTHDPSRRAFPCHSSSDNGLLLQQDRKNLVLRAVDRTLEFSDSIVVDSPHPQQQQSYRR